MDTQRQDIVRPARAGRLVAAVSMLAASSSAAWTG